MNKKYSDKWLYIIIGLAMALFLGLVIYIQQGRVENARNNASEVSSNVKLQIGNDGIATYTIVCGPASRAAAKRLQKLIYDESGERLRVSFFKPSDNYIRIKTNKKADDKIIISEGNIFVFGANGADCIESVNFLANSYLGYAFAGESREHVLNNIKYVNIPENVYSAGEEEWIPEREPIICLWKTDNARGIFYDGNVALQSEILSYSDDDLYQYIKMMKYCGYTGIQVTDMCSTWAQYGGYEFVQDRIRFMADAAHSMDMNFTLWVWGAEFNGYGWCDRSVEYFGDGSRYAYAKEDPEGRETFDKYYSIYAELADCSDRIILHFNDPGNVPSSEDIGYFTNFFKNKCRAINPDVKIGVNCYTYQIDLDILKDYAGNDLTVYSGIAHSEDEIKACSDFRQYAVDRGFDVGVWSWNLTEMEIDQLAEMNVNAGLISKCYNYTKNADSVAPVNYWSEMDSYHVLNVFSMYVAGQLLMNPELNEDELLLKVSSDVVGNAYANDLYEALKIIEDARCGQNFTEFKSGNEDYILKSDSYPAESILERCDAVIPKMERMIEADIEDNTIPLPVSVNELLSMILPHLEQIREFAQFRVNLNTAAEMIRNKEGLPTVQHYLYEMYKPVKEYNTVVGAWGQPEAKAQYELMIEFCEKNNLIPVYDSVFDYYRKQRIYGEMTAFQQNYDGCYKVEKGKAFQYGLAFGEKETQRLVNDMILEGLLTEDEDGRVYLTDWENCKYDF